jgi:hypothetical protein
MTGWLVTGVLLLTGVAGCAGYYRDGPPYYTSDYHYYPYHYHYYPSSDIYFNISSGYYYYRDGAHWKRARTLPPRRHIDRKDRVRLWIDADWPQDRHRQHRDKYKPKPGYRPDSRRDPEERRENERLHERYNRRDKKASGWPFSGGR